MRNQFIDGLFVWFVCFCWMFFGLLKMVASFFKILIVHCFSYFCIQLSNTLLQLSRDGTYIMDIPCWRNRLVGLQLGKMLYGWVQLIICRTQISNAAKNIYFPMTQVTFLEFPHWDLSKSNATKQLRNANKSCWN
jgi:hypothetical protein